MAIVVESPARLLAFTHGSTSNAAAKRDYKPAKIDQNSHKQQTNKAIYVGFCLMLKRGYINI